MSAAQQIGQPEASPEPINPADHIGLVRRAIGMRGTRSHMGNGLDIKDLEQAGLIGVMRAIKSFDASRGFAFSTYANYWIRQHVDREIQNHSRIVRTPIHKQAQRRKRGEHPRVNQSSLDAPVGDAAGRTHLDYLSDPNAPAPSAPLETRERKAALAQILERAGLDQREMRIIHGRFGLNGYRSRDSRPRDPDGREQGLSEIAVELGCSRERVRQLEKQALQKLRSVACWLGFESEDM